MRWRLKSISNATMAFVMGAAVVYGMPHSIVLSSAKVKPHNTVSPLASETPDSAEAEGSEAEETPDSEDHDGDQGEMKVVHPQSGHGAVVSTAAHCAIKGAAHGALVSSIASDPDATIAVATAACESAGGKIPSAPGRSAEAHDRVHGKSGEAHGNSAAHGPETHPTKR